MSIDFFPHESPAPVGAKPSDITCRSLYLVLMAIMFSICLGSRPRQRGKSSLFAPEALSLFRRSALFLRACSPEDGRYLMASRSWR